MVEETITRVINESMSSLDIGTPAKGGNIKVYYNANNLEEAKKLVDNAIKLREYANTLMSTEK